MMNICERWNWKRRLAEGEENGKRQEDKEKGDKEDKTTGLLGSVI
jgi:hypothetical protein